MTTGQLGALLQLFSIWNQADRASNVWRFAGHIGGGEGSLQKNACLLMVFALK